MALLQENAESMTQKIIETHMDSISRIAVNRIKRAAFLSMKRNQYMTGMPSVIQTQETQQMEPHNIKEKHQKVKNTLMIHMSRLGNGNLLIFNLTRIPVRIRTHRLNPRHMMLLRMKTNLRHS